MSKFGSGPIVVTGASGWVGRTVLNQLAQMLPEQEFRSRLRAFSSRSGVIELVDGQTVPTRPLSDLPALVGQEGFSSFLHAAFLTPDRCAELGIETYVYINQTITQAIVEAVKSSPSPRVVEFSSGAASYAETNLCMGSPAVQLYGALKLAEEQHLQAIAPTLVLRIYGLSRSFIRNLSSYALGSFLQSALQKKQITVRASSPVIRGYVNASDVVRCALNWLFSEDLGPSPIGAVNDIVTLNSLANLISSLYGLQPPLVPRLEGKPSSYSCSPIRFKSLCHTYGINPMSIVAQILDTAQAFHDASVEG